MQLWRGSLLFSKLSPFFRSHYALVLSLSFLPNKIEVKGSSELTHKTAFTQMIKRQIIGGCTISFRDVFKQKKNHF